MRHALELPRAGRWVSPPNELNAPDLDLRLLGLLAVREYLHIYHRLQIQGRENLPANGSFVIVANHTSHLDALCLLGALPVGRLQRTYSAAAEDYFCGRWWGPTLGAFIHAVPISRQGHIHQSLNRCRDLLSRESNVLIFFPEGTRSCIQNMGTFRRGVGTLVAGTNIPVVPVGIHNAQAAFPKGSMCPRPRQLRLVIGRPRQYGGLMRGRQSNLKIAEDLQAAVGELLCR